MALPVSVTSFDGSKISYVAEKAFDGVMLMNSQLNVGAGPPVIRLEVGTNEVVVPQSVGGGQTFFLFWQGQRISGDFPSLGPAGPMMMPPPPGDLQLTEIEITGTEYRAALGTWILATKQDGVTVFLPPLRAKGDSLTITNWSSMSGFGPQDAKPLATCITHPDGNTSPFLTIRPGQSIKFVTIQGRMNNLRWIPYFL
jgi:hypothetical protein